MSPITATATLVGERRRTENVVLPQRCISSANTGSGRYIRTVPTSAIADPPSHVEDAVGRPGRLHRRGPQLAAPRRLSDGLGTQPAMRVVRIPSSMERVQKTLI